MLGWGYEVKEWGLNFLMLGDRFKDLGVQDRGTQAADLGVCQN